MFAFPHYEILPECVLITTDHSTGTVIELIFQVCGNLCILAVIFSSRSYDAVKKKIAKRIVGNCLNMYLDMGVLPDFCPCKVYELRLTIRRLLAHSTELIRFYLIFMIRGSLQK